MSPDSSFPYRSARSESHSMQQHKWDSFPIIPASQLQFFFSNLIFISEFGFVKDSGFRYQIVCSFEKVLHCLINRWSYYITFTSRVSVFSTIHIKWDDSRQRAGQRASQVKFLPLLGFIYLLSDIYDVLHQTYVLVYGGIFQSYIFLKGLLHDHLLGEKWRDLAYEVRSN